jgi:uncharacterized protein (TIRG00374 family)
VQQEPSTPDVEPPESYVPIEASIGRVRWLRATLGVGLLALAALFYFADLGELATTLRQANIWLLPLPVLCVALSYVTLALSYQGIGTAAGYTLPFGEMLKITFVANTANYLVATGGLSGFAVRMYFFTRHSIPSGTAIVISLAQTFLTNVSMLLFILAGFVYLFAVHDLRGPAMVTTSVLVVIFLAAALLAGLMLFHARLRRRTLFSIAQFTHWFMHRVVPNRAPARTHIWRYQFNLNRGIAFLLEQRRQMIAPLLYILADWVFTLLVLYTSFVAVRHPVSAAYVVVGFALGIVLSLASLIPGGLGVMEGSMAAIYTSLGVPYETAVVAVLIFRIAYYVLPLLFSLLFLRGMFLQGTHLRPSAEAGSA